MVIICFFFLILSFVVCYLTMLKRGITLKSHSSRIHPKSQCVVAVKYESLVGDRSRARSYDLSNGSVTYWDPKADNWGPCPTNKFVSGSAVPYQAYRSTQGLSSSQGRACDMNSLWAVGSSGVPSNSVIQILAGATRLQASVTYSWNAEKSALSPYQWKFPKVIPQSEHNGQNCCIQGMPLGPLETDGPTRVALPSKGVIHVR